MLYVLKKDTPFCKWPLAQLEAHKVCSLESIYKWWNVKVTVECLTRAVWSSLECVIRCVLSALLETLCYKTLIARIKVVASLQCSATKQLNLECSEVLNTDLGNPHERVMCWRKCFIFISKDSERITLWLWLVFILRSLFKIWNFKETGCKPWGESEKQKSLAKNKKKVLAGEFFYRSGFFKCLLLLWRLFRPQDTEVHLYPIFSIRLSFSFSMRSKHKIDLMC